jgi:hypothetical protein
MPNKFIIYTYPRSGSYNLVQLLDSGHDIICHGEIFHQERFDVPPEYLDKIGMTLEERNMSPLLLIERLRALDPDKHFGFKLFGGHINRVPTLRTLLNDKSWLKIVLTRDPIETYGSYLRAYQSKVWYVRDDMKVDPELLKQKATFTPETWRNHVANIEAWMKACAKLNSAFFISYDAYQKPQELAKLLRYLGSSADADELTSAFKRQFSGSVENGFTNWAEFAEYMKVVPPPHMLTRQPLLRKVRGWFKPSPAT